ncbi:alpha/beta hydrolase, partial [Chryseobacterium sp. HMWF001]
MKYYRNIFTALIFITSTNLLLSQVKPLDAELTNYQYPFEVQFLNFKSQKNDLRMAY